MEGKLVTSAGTASEDVRGSSSVCVISDFEGWSVWDGWLGTVSGVVSDTLESKLVRPRSGLNAGLAARDGNSEEALLDPGLSAPFTTAFASRSCSLVLGLLLDEFRDNPCSCCNLAFSAAAFSVVACFAASSVALLRADA